MKSFQHATPAFRTYCGADSLAFLPRELDRLQARRAVIFCGGSIARQGTALALVRAALGERCVAVFDGVREHSPVPSVQDGRRVLHDARADAVVAVGGGSAVVTARGAAILLAEDREPRELCTQRLPGGKLVSPKLDAPKLPQWVVATTPTTAYAKAGTALRDPGTGDRLALFDPKTRAQALFVHPDLAATAPAALFRTAGIHALTVAVSSLESAVDDPLAEALLRHALLVLDRELPRLESNPDDTDARMRLMLAALLCGQGSDSMSGGACAAISHALGPHSGVANGLVAGIVLPHVMRFNVPATGERLARIADTIGAPGAAGTAAERAVGAVEALLQRLGVPRRLRDAGVSRDAMPAVADHAMDDWFLQGNPRRLGRDDVLALLEAAW